MPTMPCGAPVQCFVRSSARRSFIDHTLKYGSCVTRGTAGGLNEAAVWAAETTAADSRSSAAVRTLNFEPRVRLIEKVHHRDTEAQLVEIVASSCASVSLWFNPSKRKHLTRWSGRASC